MSGILTNTFQILHCQEYFQTCILSGQAVLSRILEDLKGEPFVKVSCPGCQAAFSIQDEKIPAGKGVKILCPRCKVTIELKGPKEPPPTPEELSPPGKWDVDSDPPEPEVYEADRAEEGLKAALLCMSDAGRIEFLQSTLRPFGFQVFVAPSSAVALNKLQHSQYEFILVDEDLGEGGAGHALLRHFQLLPMHLRRRFFLCYLTRKLPSLDRFAAFRVGADVILNVADLKQSGALLGRAMSERDAFYRVFRTELQKRGQF